MTEDKNKERCGYVCVHSFFAIFVLVIKIKT